MNFSSAVITSAFTRTACPNWVFWPLSAAFWAIPTLSWADETPLLAAIARDWKTRESRTSTLDCQWTAEVVLGAKVLWYLDEQGKRIPTPPEDFRTNGDYRFRLRDRQKMRYEFTQPRLIPEMGTFVTRRYLSLTDGADQKSYYGKDNVSDDPRFPPRGFVNEKETLPETITIHLWPLLLLYRPSTLHTAAQFDLTKFSAKGQITIAGRECLLLERSGGVPGKQELVIDRNRASVPVRVRNLVPNTSKGDGAWLATTLIEIDYVDQADGNWRPIRWKTAAFGEDGKIIEQMKAVVKKFDVNAEIPASEFQLDFPVGTIVRNYRTNEHYLLREGGVKRRITDAESDARISYKQLLATEPGKGLRPSGGGWRVVGLVVCSVLLLLFVVVRLRYARSKRA